MVLNEIDKHNYFLYLVDNSLFPKNIGMDYNLDVIHCNTDWRIDMSFSIRLTNEEKKLAQAYARIHGISVGEAMKQALFEKIEDEFDIADLELALKDFEKDPTTYTVEEAKKMLGL